MRGVLERLANNLKREKRQSLFEFLLKFSREQRARRILNGSDHRSQAILPGWAQVVIEADFSDEVGWVVEHVLRRLIIVDLEHQGNEAAHNSRVRRAFKLQPPCPITGFQQPNLALAAFEMAEAAGVGVQIDMDDTPTLFGEDQARYLVACNFDQAEALMINAQKAGVSITSVGKFTGDSVKFGTSEASLEELSATFRSSFAAAVA